MDRNVNGRIMAGGQLGLLIAKEEDEYKAFGRNTRKDSKLGSSIVKCLTFTIQCSTVYG
jgi:hypothetical protein